MTDTTNAPERIWMTAEDRGASWPGAFRAFRCSDLDHSNDDGPNPDYPEYVLATHCDELVAAAYLDAGWRIEQCLWSYHWYLDGESVDPEDLSRGILKRTPDNARAALSAYGERMKSEGAREAQAKLDELRSDRPFIVGWNEGFAEAEYQQAHGKPSDGDLSPQYQHTAKEVAEAQAKIARLTEALTPSGDTKAAYMGEFEFIVFGMNDDGEECSHKITVPWTAIKEIMAAIKARAALQENANE